MRTDRRCKHCDFASAGYVHTAFTFGYESNVHKSKIDGSQIPPGALLSFMQRGVNFVEIEESIVNQAENGAPATSAMDGVTSLLDVHKCLNSEDFKKGRPERVARDRANAAVAALADGMEIDGRADAAASGGTVAGRGKEVDIASSGALTLRGHTSEVFVCAWNPKSNLLASGSGDSTARIWPIPNVWSPNGAGAHAPTPIVLEHVMHDGKDLMYGRQKSNDVTTLQWNPDGETLATGCYDGCARLWSKTGQLRHTLDLHKGPLFSLKWSKSGKRILSGSVDASTAVWDGESGGLVKQFNFHNAPTLDVDWRDENTFASCSTDKMIFLCALDSNTPLMSYEGHRDEINCLKFDPSGTLLASCSDDFTAKIWTASSTRPACDFKEHYREVYTMQWSPNANAPMTLATASFDAGVKLWDVNANKCTTTLNGHTDPVYSLDFSPDGQFLATGSFDRCINIWRVKDGKLLKKFRGDGGIFEVTWNPAGDQVAGCFSSNTVSVIDLRKMMATTTVAV